ncbi:MAG: hypothetical protein AAF387_06710 [Pseudomonadota bacterium]
MDLSSKIELNNLRHTIRYGLQPDEPSLLSVWLEKDTAVLQQGSSVTERRRVHVRQFELLLDTIADELVAANWRQLCLDQIYKPLAALAKITNDEMSTRHLVKLRHELAVTAQYYENSISNGQKKNFEKRNTNESDANRE